MNKLFKSIQLRRFHILHSKPKHNKGENKKKNIYNNKLQQQPVEVNQIQTINNRKTCYIDYDVKFNEYGLHLLAESPNKTTDLFQNINIVTGLALIYLDFRAIFLVLGFYYYKIYTNYVFQIDLYKEISEIFLTHDLDKILVKCKQGQYQLCPIKDIKLLTEQEFNSNPNNHKLITVKIYNNEKHIKSNIIIHNRELFCAAFNGYEIKRVSTPGVYKLKTTDSINYTI